MADVTVLIDTRSNSSEQFLVTVHTRHANLHNGYARVRFEGLVQANRPTRVPIEFYLSRIGYGVTAYHPDYLLESDVTRQRGDDLPALFPRRWDAVLAGITALPLNGPEPTYAGAVGHVELYRDKYLPALDRAGVEPDSAVMSRLAALLTKADALVTFPVPAHSSIRYDQDKLKKRRAFVLSDIAKLIASSRARRLALAAFREATTTGPMPIIAALREEPDYRSLLTFVAGVSKQKPVGALPQSRTWQNSTTGLRFTYRIVAMYPSQRGGESPDCSRGQLTYDGRSIVEGVSGDLVRKIELEFCRQSAGTWDVAGRWAR
jgi:hypothetical protein